jgi:type II secretory pathway component HofQ
MPALRVLLVLCLPLALAVTDARAQDPPPAPIVLPKPPSPSEGPGLSERNVRVDVTVTVKGTDKTVAKSLALVAADGREGQGRAGVQLPIVMQTNPDPAIRANVSYRDVGINVDAAPRILPSGKVSVRMKLNFSNVLSVSSGGTSRPSFGNGSHEVNAVVFESGKPLVVLEGGDPETGRTYVVEVKATILK